MGFTELVEIFSGHSDAYYKNLTENEQQEFLN